MVSKAVAVEQKNLFEPPNNPVEEPKECEFHYSDNDSVGSENSDINPIQKFEGHDLFKNIRWKHNGVDITEIIKKKQSELDLKKSLKKSNKASTQSNEVNNQSSDAVVEQAVNSNEADNEANEQVNASNTEFTSKAADVQAVDSTNEALETSNEGVNATKVQAVDSTDEAVKTSNEDVQSNEESSDAMDVQDDHLNETGNESNEQVKASNKKRTSDGTASQADAWTNEAVNTSNEVANRTNQDVNVSNEGADPASIATNVQTADSTNEAVNLLNEEGSKSNDNYNKSNENNEENVECVVIPSDVPLADGVPMAKFILPVPSTPVCGIAVNHLPLNLVPMYDSTYCSTGQRFHGSQCRLCYTFFVDKVKGEKQFKPNNNTPFYYCKNHKFRCTYAVCYKCQNTHKALLKRARSKTANLDVVPRQLPKKNKKQKK